MDDLGNAEATALFVPAAPPIAAPDSEPLLIVKEEPAQVIQVPAEDRVIRVQRGF